MKQTLWSFALLMCATCASAQEVRTLSVGTCRISAEVAADAETRQLGLMYRESLGKNEGMLFVFPRPRRYCMWMKNTKIPLTVAFLDDRGRVLNLEDMQAETEDSHCASEPALYALELSAGRFNQCGVKPGGRLKDLLRP